VPTAPAGTDRRIVLRLVLTGATGAAFVEAGVPVIPGRPWSGPAIEISSVQRTIAALAAGYDMWGPQKVGATVKTAETVMHRVFAVGVPAKHSRDALATYARLEVMSATASGDAGHYGRAGQAASRAVAMATEAGDDPLIAHAWSVVAASARLTGKPHHALVAAQRARSHAGRSPAAVMALLQEAFAGAEFSGIGAFAVYDAVTAAEEVHASLPEQAWGSPGYSLGTYHPANLKAYAGSALIKAGLYSEAVPRLAEAADILADTNGLEKAYVWLLQARVALGTGAIDEAHDLAARAAKQADGRPAEWVARHVRELDQQSRGALTDLVEHTSQWSFTTTP
jgi:hypothetical protein